MNPSIIADRLTELFVCASDEGQPASRPFFAKTSIAGYRDRHQVSFLVTAYPNGKFTIGKGSKRFDLDSAVLTITNLFN
jgi:hypothetical protein